MILLAFPMNVAAQTTFIDVQRIVGITFTHQLADSCFNPPIGSGSAWADYDNDGDVDLYITNLGGPSRLFRNDGDINGDGLPDFTDVAQALGVEERNLQSHGVVFIDYDNDGDQDLYITHLGGNTLYQNRLAESGFVTFDDVTVFAGVGDSDRAITAAWADYDQDGWLDLYLAKHFDCMPSVRESRDALYKNNGNGTFTDVSQYLCADHSLTCSQLNLSHAFTAGWFDYDNDGDPDLYIASDVVAAGWHNILWRNDGSDGAGGWTFTDVSAESGTDYSINCKGLGVGDYDSDGYLDLAYSHSEGGYLLHNNGDGTFEDVSIPAGVRRIYTPHGDVATEWGTAFFDYDNDGWLDLFYVGGMINNLTTPQPDALFRNNHDGTFADVSAQAGIDDPRRGRCASICDFNRDGFVDLFVGNWGQPADLFFNQGPVLGNTNHWLTIIPEGGGMVNRDAIGTRLSLTTPDGITQIREITSGPTYGGGDHKVAHFGMGTNTTGTLEVRWPDGETYSLGEVSADQHLHISRTTGASDDDPIVSRFELLQNYPNPFNPKSEIGIRIAETGQVTLKVYDLLGREVAVLLDAHKAPGSYSVTWDATGFPSGVYYYRMNVQPAEGGRAGDYVETKKLVLLR